MELQFSTKEESNLRRELAFLNLTPAKRLETFLQMLCEFQALPVKKGLKHKNDDKNNFVLVCDA